MHRKFDGDESFGHVLPSSRSRSAASASARAPGDRTRSPFADGRAPSHCSEFRFLMLFVVACRDPHHKPEVLFRLHIASYPFENAQNVPKLAANSVLHRRRRRHRRISQSRSVSTSPFLRTTRRTVGGEVGSIKSPTTGHGHTANFLSPILLL